eukprot:gene55051-75437_t
MLHARRAECAILTGPRLPTAGCPSARELPHRMFIPFTSSDLGRTFDARSITRGRTLALLGEVEVEVDGASVQVGLAHLGQRHTGRLTAELEDGEIHLRSACTCRAPFCPHMAAGALVALER